MIENPTIAGSDKGNGCPEAGWFLPSCRPCASRSRSMITSVEKALSWTFSAKCRRTWRYVGRRSRSFITRFRHGMGNGGTRYRESCFQSERRVVALDLAPIHAGKRNCVRTKCRFVPDICVFSLARERPTARARLRFAAPVIWDIDPAAPYIFREIFMKSARPRKRARD